MSLPSDHACPGRLPLGHRLAGASAIVALQVTAAVYFIFDSIDDAAKTPGSGLTGEIVMECVVALALAGGVALGFRHVLRLRADLRRQADALAVARGALAEHIRLRFEQWRLTSSEADVALFSLKGFQIAEIAKLRSSAPGTVRSQLSQIYSKAGVANQAMLLSLFFDELLQRGETADANSPEARSAVSGRRATWT